MAQRFRVLSRTPSAAFGDNLAIFRAHCNLTFESTCLGAVECSWEPVFRQDYRGYPEPECADASEQEEDEVDSDF